MMPKNDKLHLLRESTFTRNLFLNFKGIQVIELASHNKFLGIFWDNVYILFSLQITLKRNRIFLLNPIH